MHEAIPIAMEEMLLYGLLEWDNISTHEQCYTSDGDRQ